MNAIANHAMLMYHWGQIILRTIGYGFRIKYDPADHLEAVWECWTGWRGGLRVGCTAEQMEISKPKHVKAKKASAHSDAMDTDDSMLDRVMTCLRPQGQGISKKQAAGKRKGKKDALVFHVGKNTAGKKKAKRRASNK